MRRTSTGVVPAALGATFLVLVAFTSAITTAADTAGSFGAGIGWQTWILSSMSLGLAGALMTCGALADERGARWAMIAGTAGLLAASVLAAVAPSIGVFVAARCCRASRARRCWWPRWASSRWPCPPGRSAPGPRGCGAPWSAPGIAAGPVLAGLLAELTDWRLVHWAEAAGALAVLVAARGLPDLRAGCATPSIRPAR